MALIHSAIVVRKDSPWRPYGQTLYGSPDTGVGDALTCLYTYIGIYIGQVSRGLPSSESPMASKIFPTNESPSERAIRIVLGFTILSLAFIGPKTPWAYLGIVLVLTGFMGSCPLYTVFGFSTCARPSKP
jgi:hypothetical protein